jgi:excinuclease ABC subunit C
MLPDIKSSLLEQIKLLENSPGVYQFYDADDRILYVGKAKKLKNRVSSYFSKVKFENNKTKVMVSKIDTLKTIYLDSEIDALLLENTLIKKHQPRYNVQLKDDKTYPWICIKSELYPRIFHTRNKVDDGSLYFGPYPSVKVVKSVIELAKESFDIRSCSHNLTEEKIKNGEFLTAVDYYIGNCKGCCQGLVEDQNYQNKMDLVKQVLSGYTAKVVKELREEMKGLANLYKYEEAEKIKVKITNIEKFQAKSVVVDSSISSLSVVNYVKYDAHIFVNLLKVINGTITKTKTIVVQKQLEETDEEILSLVVIDNLEEFFSEAKELVLPPNIVFKSPIKIHSPKRGGKRTLLLLSKKNAMAKKMEFVKAEALKNPEQSLNRLLNTIKKDLRLPSLPLHMECFDNSNFQGDYPVAACVVFKNAKPSKKDYRHFNIKTVEGANDFASMEEVIYRRYYRMIKENQPIPQLIIIDGGKGQLSSAIKSLKALDLHSKVAVIGIAKKLEELFFPGDKYPLYLDKKTPTLKVIQHMRNEAHRFGITHHRKKRLKGVIHTELTTFRGIGEKTANILLKKHKSVKHIKTISQEELSELIGKSKAKILFNNLHP